jgi:hypothetical protein
LAKAFFDVGEYKRAAHALERAQERRQARRQQQQEQQQVMI